MGKQHPPPTTTTPKQREFFTTPSYHFVSTKTSLVSESLCIKKPFLIENAFEKQSDSVTALRSDYLAPLLLPVAPLAVWMVASLSSASVSSSFFRSLLRRIRTGRCGCCALLPINGKTHEPLKSVAHCDLLSSSRICQSAPENVTLGGKFCCFFSPNFPSHTHSHTLMEKPKMTTKTA